MPKVISLTEWQAGYRFSHVGGRTHQSRAWRVDFSAWRDNQVSPALDFIRKSGLRAEAQQLNQALANLRQFVVQISEINITRLLLGSDEVTRRINIQLEAIGRTEAAVHARLNAVQGILPIKYTDLPAYDTPRGWMTAEAARDADGDAGRIVAVERIFQGNYQGERGAPVEGFPHYHVNGQAFDVMSIRHPDMILGFTDHMDNTGPGRMASGRVRAMETNAANNGWAWIAIVNSSLRHINNI